MGLIRVDVLVGSVLSRRPRGRVTVPETDREVLGRTGRSPMKWQVDDGTPSTVPLLWFSEPHRGRHRG